MDPKIDFLQPQLINVFQVIQIAAGSFLADVLGLDYIVIAPNTRSEVHRHNHSDNLIYVIRGSAELILDGAAHAVRPGVRVFIPRGMLHGFRTLERGLEFVSAQVPPILDSRTGRFDREVVEQ